MIYIFRLSRLTGVDATFTLGREIVFDKLIYRGCSVDNFEVANSDQTDFDDGNSVAMYIECDFIDENSLIFNNGNLTTNGTPAHLIPVTGVDGTSIHPEELTLISQPTVFEASKQIRIKLKECTPAGVAVNTEVDAAFGAAVTTDGGSTHVHQGINIFFEFQETRAHNHKLGATVFADST